MHGSAGNPAKIKMMQFMCKKSLYIDINRDKIYRKLEEWRGSIGDFAPFPRES